MRKYYIITKFIPGWPFAGASMPQKGTCGYQVNNSDSDTPKDHIWISFAPSHLGYFAQKRMVHCIPINCLKYVGTKSPNKLTTKQARKKAEEFNFGVELEEFKKRERRKRELNLLARRIA